MTRLGDSEARVHDLLARDLSCDTVVEELLTETSNRRRLDLSDLGPKEQAELIAARAVDVLPSVEALVEAIEVARAAGRPLTVKLGIDPTAADMHLGHAVPVIILNRLQRMGHHAVLIIGDITARIGDPSGRSAERPPLTDEQIAVNLATYREQLAPFFDFDRAESRRNSEWLADIRLPELIRILSRIPVSMSLQREDFRARLAHGQPLAMSEFLYSVVMAIDSVAIDANVELGGVDQLLNMQMGRKVMEVVGRTPQLVVTLPLIEGTDGSGAKMSKSLGNYVALSAPPGEVYGKIMSVPDRLMVPYLRAWTEWTDSEIRVVTERLDARTLHPMELKRILAGEAVAALHGVDAAMAARRAFTAQFSRRSFSDVDTLPVVDAAAAGETVGTVLTRLLAFTPSVSAARRIARQNGVRVIVESDDGQQTITLAEEDLSRPVREVASSALASTGRSVGDANVYLRAGRRVARVETR